MLPARAFIYQIKRTGQLLFSKYLLATNIGISAGLSGTGDILEQQIEKHITTKLSKWEKERTLKMSTAGAVVGVICHYWYLYLDNKFIGRGAKVVFKKLMLDQCLFSPFLIFTYFVLVGSLDGHKWSEIMDSVKSKYLRLYAAEWIVWPPAQLINFWILPTRFRVLYDNTISLGYDIYTSYVLHDD
ncbi:mpv17-like protein 2 isoform X2 [Artemia franciscana]|uniref:Mpv17-like protein 2 n=2 Tax=Artemia franciscana TaxID=6661 RepID=A0AA88I4X4_ARTSF|nr:hypothetical protein QYM36_003154 [Artemia franciscana]